MPNPNDCENQPLNIEKQHTNVQWKDTLTSVVTFPTENNVNEKENPFEKLERVQNKKDNDKPLQTKPLTNKKDMRPFYGIQYMENFDGHKKQVDKYVSNLKMHDSIPATWTGLYEKPSQEV